MNKDIPEQGILVHQVHRICWSAIFSGAFVGIGLGFLLHLYGMAISLSAFSSSINGAKVIAIGGFLGMLVGVIASMMASGFVAGYLGRFHYQPVHGGVIYGFVTWSLIIFLSAIMIGPMQNYIVAYGNTLTHSVVSSDVKTTSLTVNSNTVKIEKNNNETATVSKNALAWAGWIIFILFFVGALSSCIGAICGMHCKRELVTRDTL